MNIVTKPTVTVVGKWEFIDHPDYPVPDDGTNMERGLAFAAKGCYQSWGKEGRSCVENQRGVVAHGHGSVAEHATITVFVEGVTRSLTLEMNRHRHLGISQESTRYVAEEDTSIVLAPHYTWLYDMFYKPYYNLAEHLPEGIDREAYHHRATAVDTYLESCEEAIMAYTDQVDFLMEDNPLGLDGFNLRKWARGEARNLLPHCIETKVTYTGNLRGWRHFLEARTSRHAEPEIRRLAQEIYLKIKDYAPVYFEDYEENLFPEECPEGYPSYLELITENRKI